MRGAFVRPGRAACAVVLALTSLTLLGVNTLTDNFARRVVAAHNRERDSLGIPRLEWSETLAGQARGWAEHLAKVGYLAHSEDAPDGPDLPGENLWAGTKATYPVEQMIDFWLAERRHYHPGRFPDNSTTGEVEDVGHYTQAVWRGTHRVGCALAENGEGQYLVCRYHEAGNVIGEKPY